MGLAPSVAIARASASGNLMTGGVMSLVAPGTVVVVEELVVVEGTVVVVLEPIVVLVELVVVVVLEPIVVVVVVVVVVPPANIIGPVTPEVRLLICVPIPGFPFHKPAA